MIGERHLGGHVHRTDTFDTLGMGTYFPVPLSIGGRFTFRSSRVSVIDAMCAN